MEQKMKLGQTLKTCRQQVGKTLRDVEGETGISNGYLSLLESDAVKQPSPNHLHKLSEYYHVGYARLMELAGYVAPRRQVALTKDRERTSQFAGWDELDEKDKKKIQAYIEDLRDARRVRAATARTRARRVSST